MLGGRVSFSINSKIIVTRQDIILAKSYVINNFVKDTGILLLNFLRKIESINYDIVQFDQEVL